MGFSVFKGVINDTIWEVNCQCALLLRSISTSPNKRTQLCKTFNEPRDFFRFIEAKN